MGSSIAYIGLGSNIEQPELQIKSAILALDILPGTSVLIDSGYYKSKPMGPGDQPDFINAVVQIETTFTATELLKQCQLIEKQQGRIKVRHWGERSIDLDILLFADEQIRTDVLIVPHSGICQRDFVYLPLLKLKPNIKVPGKGLLSKTIEKSAGYGCQFAGNIGR